LIQPRRRESGAKSCLPPWVPWIGTIGWLAVAAGSAVGQSAPRLTGHFPQGGQRGTAVELTLYGENLAAARELLISGAPGLTGEVLAPPPARADLIFSGSGIAAEESAREGPLRIRVRIDPEAACEPRELRVGSPDGVSNPVNIYVDDFPETVEREPNDAPDGAFEIELPVIVSGAIARPAESDHLAFVGRKGERVLAEVLAQRIGSPLDGSLTLLDASGRELATVEDTLGADPLLDFTLPDDGRYLLRLRDIRFQGSPGHVYRFRIGFLPRLDGLFPMGGRRGERVEVELIGRNLPAGARKVLMIEPEAPLGSQEVRTRTEAGLSNPVPFVIGDLPERLEEEPNDDPQKATAIAPPITINGRLQEPGDRDAFRFRAEAGTRLVFEVEAGRLGAPLDGLLELMDAEGNVLARDDDAVAPDPRIEQAFEKGGEYTLVLSDLLKGGGSLYAYRLTVRPPEPDFSLTLTPDNPRVHRGGCGMIAFEVRRAAGFGGAVLVALAGLPEGVVAAPVLIPAGANRGLMTLQAGPTATIGHAALAAVGYGVLDGRRLSRSAQPRVGERTPREAFLTVTEPAPFGVEVVTLAAEVNQGSSADVEVRVERRGGFQGEIRLSAEGLPRGVSAGDVRLENSRSRATLRLQGGPDAEPGERSIFVLARATAGGRTYTQASAAFPLIVGEVPFVFRDLIPRLSLTAQPEGSRSAAGEAVLTIKADRRGWFNEPIAVRLEGLPEGVSAEPIVIERGQTEGTVTLAAGTKAPVDAPLEIRVLGEVELRNRRFTFRSDPITLTVSAPVVVAAGED